MNRPTIEQFFSSGTTPGDIQKAFLAQPELYKYITALDAYIDYLEDFYVKSESLKMIEHIAEHGLSQEIINSFDKHETPFGDILIKKMNRLAIQSQLDSAKELLDLAVIDRNKKNEERLRIESTCTICHERASIEGLWFCKECCIENNIKPIQ